MDDGTVDGGTGGASGAAHQVAFFLRELSAEEPGRRAAAVKGLGRLGQWDEHGDVVVRAARDAEAEVRAGAADALGRLGDAGDSVAGAVVVELMGDADPHVRRRASLAAERLALTGPTVTEAFRRLLLDDSDWHLRLNGLLGLSGRDETVDTAVFIRLLGERTPYLWGPARRALLASLPRKPVLDEVLRTAEHGHGLARVRALEMLPAEDIRRMRDSLLAGLRDESPDVRWAVVRQLSKDRRPSTADALLSALEAETDTDTAARLLRTLGRWKETRAVPAAVRWLDRPETGSIAVQALVGIGTPTAVEWLRATVAATPGPEVGPGLGRPEVRAAAATALGELAATGSTLTLLALLHDPDERVRAGAVDGLRLLGRRRLRRRRRGARAEALLGLLTTDEPIIGHTRDALSEYPETRPALRRLIDHPSDEVRAAVLSLLDEDDDGDVALFLSHLDDPSEPVRHEALVGIGRYVYWYEELPDVPDGLDLLAVITALSRSPAVSSRTRYEAGRLLDELKGYGVV
ncbi:HEAT repeat domain-containing protein [Streptomyces sp. DSM 40750]|uniref:HEAT repeat domain-containing protein n=1 Tax=Streptomyces sp. DSM 40750 TaxID=2801030 RepID=UPI00214B0A85|nr:HEAT repeat domain-containing protein [Streptomyces sp. DSM 40750]UUU23622.1 HEAT repeat domain-containing protein [Streptomyces sp. DSM 40750]